MLQKVILSAVLVAFCACSPPVPTVVALSSADSLFFRAINPVAERSRWGSLRDKYVPSGDVEIRVWRGFGLEPLEGVLLRRTDGIWSGAHVLQNRMDSASVDVEQLREPKSGWAEFSAKVVDAQLMDLVEPSVRECEPDVVDGSAVVIEVNRDRSYRNAMYPEFLKECDASRAVTRLAHQIGREFDDGKGACTRAEWFPCATYREEHGIADFPK